MTEAFNVLRFRILCGETAQLHKRPFVRFVFYSFEFSLPVTGCRARQTLDIEMCNSGKHQREVILYY